MYFLPESPRWLVAQDQHEKALKVLARLHAHGDTDNLYVQSELKEIVAKINLEKLSATPSYSMLLFGEESRRTWLGLGAVSLNPWHGHINCCEILTFSSQQFWQQVTGINVFV
jgi:hypothetical protein